MTARELEALLGIVWHGGTAHPAQLVAKLGITLTYARLLCAALLRQDYVEAVAGDRYQITGKGRRTLTGHRMPEGGDWGLDLFPPAVRQQLARELADEFKKEVAGTIGAMAGALPGRWGGAGEEGAREPIRIRTDYAFPTERVRLEHTLGERAEKETTGDAGAVERAAQALERFEEGRRRRGEGQVNGTHHQTV